MEIGVGVWVKDKKGKESWVPGIVVAKNDTQVTVRLDESNDDISFTITDYNEELPDVKLRNDPREVDVENLINLPYLHEPAILECLQRRYNCDEIYTYTGPILIAMNPFKKIHLYTPAILEKYYSVGLSKSQGVDFAPLPPHVYAIADAAYRDMMHGVLNGSASATVVSNQVILISGESGAGKTESTKIVLRYLTTLGCSTGSMETETGSIMDKILCSNPILEAFGNAKTIRNDNSSRFGKFIELNFNRRGHLVGGTIRTYLLEKVRLPFQQLGERNFHIFYQMMAGGSYEERVTRWCIGEDLMDFFYVNQGNVFQLRHVDDHEEFEATRKALQTLGFPDEFCVCLLDIMAGLLHVGQLQFVPDKDGEGSELSSESNVANSLNAISRLCGVPVDALQFSITKRIIIARDEQYEKKLTPVQASDARDALAKALYGKIFDWIVSTINTSIQVDKKLVRADVGVLDIFGFECFKYNSFEQLCINYTNETLQQQFNQFVFKMEQSEYEKEKIEWSFISFPDNQECLDLIEHKINGIIAMLDDECRLPKSTDEKFANRMYQSLKDHPRFSATAAQKRNCEFSVSHYAGIVNYSTNTFVEKNKDEFPREANTLFQSSTNNLIRYLFVERNEVKAEPAKRSDGTVVREARKSALTSVTVGTQFKEQLHSLMEKIYATKPHYIRCLKPNDENIPDSFNRIRTTEQLRYGGVLEAVRVARSGFPVRLSHADFYARYRPLANPYSPLTQKLPRVIPSGGSVAGKSQGLDPKHLSLTLIEALWDENIAESVSSAAEAPRMSNQRRNSRIADIKLWKGKGEISRESIQIGLTKVFLRKLAHDMLEGRRSRRLVSAAKKMQSVYRGYLQRIEFIAYVRSARVVQRVYRGYKGRGVYRNLMLNNRAKRIQRIFRAHSAYWKFQRFMYSLCRLQACYRARVSRVETHKLWFMVKGTKLKNIVLMLHHKKRYSKFRSSVIALQCCIRRSRAKRLLKEFRVAAKDLGKLQQSNDALKAEIAMLKEKAAEDARRAQLEMQRKMAEEMENAKAAELQTLQQELESTKKRLAEEIALREDIENRLYEANKRLAHSPTPAPAPTSTIHVSHTPAPVSTLQSHFPVISHSEEVETLKLHLQQERVAREQLEEEVSRLRRVSIELQADKLISNDTKHTAENPSGESRSRRNSNASAVSRTQRGDAVPSKRPSQTRRASLDEAKKVESQHWDENWDESSSGSDISRNTSVFSDERNKPKYESKQKWKKSFSETPIPSNYQRKIGETTSTPAQKAKQARALVGTFERNLETFKARLKQGIRTFIWEGRYNNAEVVLRLTDSGELSFVAPVRRFALFASKVEIKPVKIHEILECIPGAHNETIRSSGDDTNYLTIVTHSATQTPRSMSLMLDSREDRNSLMTGLRTLISDYHMNATNTTENALSRSSPMDATADANSTSPNATTTTPKVSRRSSFKQTLLEEAALNEDTLESRITDGNVDTPIKQPNSQQKVSAARRGSMPHAPHSSSKDVTHPATDDLDVDNANVSEVKRQLLVERTNYERLMVQMLVLTNDLNEREDQIIALKKREAVFQETLANKERMYEQDAMVRMQLGKRLEQVLMDKEEIKDELDNLKAQLDVLRGFSQNL